VKFDILLRGVPYSVDRPPFSRGYPIHSGVMVCPICLSMWAYLPMEGQLIYQPRAVSCASPCMYWSEFSPVPGSLLEAPTFWDGVDWELLDLLPPELLRREFNLTLKAADLWQLSDDTISLDCDPQKSGQSPPTLLGL